MGGKGGDWNYPEEWKVLEALRVSETSSEVAYTRLDSLGGFFYSASAY